VHASGRPSTSDPRQFILFGNFKYNGLKNKGKMFLSDVVEIKGGKEIMKKVEYKVRVYNTICCK